MTNEEILALARTCGFEHVGELNVTALKFEPAVREMCAAGRCGSYGKSWSCPPACGPLEEAARRAGAYRRGVILQSTGQLEDDFDIETMMDTERLQKERFMAFVEQIRRTYPGCLPMSTGACTICSRCTYPGAPCRFPENAIPSMEAYGLMVSQVCADSGLGYYYGPKTITYTACVLID